jgi:hypothetical protein
MTIRKTYIIIGLIITFAAFFELGAHADELDQTTILTFNQPIQIPGQVLPAGTYVFRLANSDSDRDLVQVFGSDQTHLYATFQTVPTERQNPTDDTSITFAQQGAGNPDGLLKWFYPALLTGHAFVYSKQEENELAQERQQVVVAINDHRPIPNLLGLATECAVWHPLPASRRRMPGGHERWSN